MKKITFVVFHQDLSEKGINELRSLVPKIAHGPWQPEYLEQLIDLMSMNEKCIDIFFRSAKLYHPKCECVVLTDQKTKFNLPQDIKIVRCKVSSDQPAKSRLLAQIEYIKKAKKDSHLVFLDYDMIVQGDLLPVFEKDFDVAVTFRMHPVPINGGVLIVYAGREKEAVSFLEKALKIFEKKYSEYNLWGGAQRSISDAAGFLDVSHLKEEMIEVDGVKILLLPAGTYNFIIGGDDRFLDYHPEKVILHFKGRRKKSMITYWNEYAKPRK